MHQYRTSWGLVGPEMEWPTLGAFVRAAKAEGYRGVEFPLAHLNFEARQTDTAIAQVSKHLAATDLKVIPLIATRPSNYASPDDHIAAFREQAVLAAQLGPSKLVVHAGSDAFSPAASVAYLQDCTRIAGDLGMQPCFETHRGRLLNDPWRAEALLSALPDLRLTLDVSHWHVVVDREPLDIMDLFDEAAARSAHVHARIGHEKGAQVPHPADPQWESHVALYHRWWSIAKSAAEERGEVFTITSEFGPPPYMNTRPFTHERDAELLELNAWMRDQLDRWFAG